MVFQLFVYRLLLLFKIKQIIETNIKIQPMFFKRRIEINPIIIDTALKINAIAFKIEKTSSVK